MWSYSCHQDSKRSALQIDQCVMNLYTSFTFLNEMILLTFWWYPSWLGCTCMLVLPLYRLDWNKKKAPLNVNNSCLYEMNLLQDFNSWWYLKSSLDSSTSSLPENVIIFVLTYPKYLVNAWDRQLYWPDRCNKWLPQSFYWSYCLHIVQPQEGIAFANVSKLHPRLPRLERMISHPPHQS